MWRDSVLEKYGIHLIYYIKQIQMINEEDLVDEGKFLSLLLSCQMYQQHKKEKLVKLYISFLKKRESTTKMLK